MSISISASKHLVAYRPPLPQPDREVCGRWSVACLRGLIGCRLLPGTSGKNRDRYACRRRFGMPQHRETRTIHGRIVSWLTPWSPATHAFTPAEITDSLRSGSVRTEGSFQREKTRRLGKRGRREEDQAASDHEQPTRIDRCAASIAIAAGPRSLSPLTCRESNSALFRRHGEPEQYRWMRHTDRPTHAGIARRRWEVVVTPTMMRWPNRCSVSSRRK
jgi:hypothetical protein